MNTERHTARLDSSLRQFIAAARVVAELLGTSADDYGRAYGATGEQSFAKHYEYRDERVRINAARGTQGITGE
jgi:hypothetical protein